jgi:hypothetical protein
MDRSHEQETNSFRQELLSLWLTLGTEEQVLANCCLERVERKDNAFALDSVTIASRAEDREEALIGVEGDIATAGTLKILVGICDDNEGSEQSSVELKTSMVMGASQFRNAASAGGSMNTEVGFSGSTFGPMTNTMTPLGSINDPFDDVPAVPDQRQTLTEAELTALRETFDLDLLNRNIVRQFELRFPEPMMGEQAADDGLSQDMGYIAALRNLVRAVRDRM